MITVWTFELKYPARTLEAPLTLAENLATSGSVTTNHGAQIGYKRGAVMGSCRHHIWQAIRASSAAPYYLDDYTDGMTSIVDRDK